MMKINIIGMTIVVFSLTALLVYISIKFWQLLNEKPWLDITIFAMAFVTISFIIAQGLKYIFILKKERARLKADTEE